MQPNLKRSSLVSANTPNQEIEYFDISGGLGFNPYVYMVIGERGCGKTFSAINFACSRFEKGPGHKFIWLRRYATEIKGKPGGAKGCKQGFGEAVTRVHNKRIITSSGNKIYVNGVQAGLFMALATGSTAKGVDFSEYDLIIFDEFLIDDPTYHYLSHEADALLGLMDSVFRPTDPTRERGQVIMLSNAVSFANPYFNYFNIKPFQGRFYFDKTRGILVEMCDSTEFREVRAQTRFGKLAQGTRYYDYAFKNEFLLDNPIFIEPRPANSKYAFGIKYAGECFGVWRDPDTWKLYVTREFDRSFYTYCITRDDHTVNTLLVKHLKDTNMNLFIEAYQFGELRFSDIRVKAAMYELLACFIR